MSQRREAQEEEYKIDPRVQAMSKKEVKLFAAMVRACGEEESEELAAQSDEQVASSLLWLQDNGYISIEFDGEDISIRLLDPPSTGQRGERLAPSGAEVPPSRRDRRRKKRRKR
jgi:hypothetical protein